MKRALLTTALVLATASAGLAHDDAAWIQSDPRYVDKAGIHCCSPHDCGRISEADICEVEPGVWMVLETRQTFRWGERGTYASKDLTPWACRVGGSRTVRCLFPQGGGF